ncbi:MAG: FG-GAP-like repeat-containing protein [Candidatus Hadarchaeales archaeon]
MVDIRITGWSRSNDGVVAGAPGWNNWAGKVFLFKGGSGEIDNNPDWTYECGQPSSDTGVSITTGDVNGDGYSDLIVGARSWDSGGYTDTGNVWIFYGGPNPDNQPDLTLSYVLRSNSYFGYSVASGDVNGDGYSDVIVGQPCYKPYPSSNLQGRAYVYYGGNPMDAQPDVTIDVQWYWHSSYNGPYELGFSVASGDVNGDGYSDVIVGQPDWWWYRGIVTIYYGGDSMNNARDCVLRLSTDNYESGVNSNYPMLGFSIDTIDLNGDGFDDIVVGAQSWGWNNENLGRVYVFYGSSSLPQEKYPDLTFVSDLVNGHFGWCVATGNDFNGDRYPDIAVGTYAWYSSEWSEGKAWIFWGGPTMDNIPDWTYESNKSDTDFGGSLKSAGDVNGDGYSDLIVGARSWDGMYDNTGKVFIFLGGSNMDNQPDFFYETNRSGANLGYHVSSAANFISTDTITFLHEGDTLEKSGLRLLKNGITVLESVGTGPWAAGDPLTITGALGLNEGDEIKLVYDPTSQIVFQKSLGRPSF